MAGDWIKMRSNLWDDPRVGALVDATDSTEAAVVGALYWLWATADQHTENGFMPGLTLRQIDRKTGVQGVAQALCAIGWLTEDSDGVTVANFTDHNGASAKRRCTEAQRKANSRTVSAQDADNTRKNGGQVRTSCVAREEKRREEYSVTNVTGGGTANRAKTPAEHRKSQLWRQMKEFLVDSGESKDLKAAGAVITKAISRYDEATALGAIEATLYARPAGAIAYLEGACQQATGQRQNKQESLEAGNLAAAKRFTESLQ